MKAIIPTGTTNYIADGIILRDSTTGQPVTDLTDSDITIKYSHGGASDVTVSAGPMTQGSYNSGGFVANSAGGYQFSVPDSAIDGTKGNNISFMFSATGALTARLTIQLDVTLAETQGNYAPAKAGDSMNLADNAIQGSKIATGALDSKGNWATVGSTMTLGAGGITSTTIAAGALNGKGDWSTYAGGDTSGTTTLLARLTAMRAGYIDNLSAGPVATFSQVGGLMFGAPSFVVPAEIIVPASGTAPVKIILFVYDDTRALVDADAAPTLTLTNAAGTDLSSRLASTTMTRDATGEYSVEYTSTSTDTLFDQLNFAASYSVDSVAHKVPQVSLTVDATADYFDATDRTKLVSIYNQSLLIGTNAADSPAAKTAQTNAATAVTQTADVPGMAVDLTTAASNTDTLVTLVEVDPNDSSLVRLTAASVANVVGTGTTISKVATMIEDDPDNAGDSRLTAAGLAQAPGSTGALTTEQAAQLTDIQTKVAATPLTVSVNSPLAETGRITLVAGDDYKSADGRAIVFSLSGVPDFTGAAASFVAGSVDASGTIASPTDNPTVTFELTAAQSQALRGSNGYAVRIVLSNGDTITPAKGLVTSA